MAKAEKMKTEDEQECAHELKDYRGSTSTTWKWTPQKCGHVEQVSKQPGQSERETAATPSTASVTPTPTTPLDDEDNQVDKIMNLVGHVLEVQRGLGVHLSVQQLGKIYDKCKESVVRSHDCRSADRSRSVRTTSFKATSVAAPSPAGVHRRRSYNEVYVGEVPYTKTLIGKLKSCTLKDPELVKYAEYAEKRKEQSSGSEAYTVNFGGDPAGEVLAVLDTGCNNTCHGDRWMARFHQMYGMMPASEPADGRFKGVGGRVSVTCKRTTIPVHMKTLDQEYVPGTITSIELEDNDAPLLLSSGAQKTLGLVIDMGKNTAYSRTLDRELELLDYNGLPAVRLHPGEVRPGSIAMTSTVDEVMTDTNDATEYVIVSDDEETVEE